jgi:hypothetical protein
MHFQFFEKFEFFFFLKIEFFAKGVFRKFSLNSSNFYRNSGNFYRNSGNFYRNSGNFYRNSRDFPSKSIKKIDRKSGNEKFRHTPKPHPANNSNSITPKRSLISYSKSCQEYFPKFSKKEKESFFLFFSCFFVGVTFITFCVN